MGIDNYLAKRKLLENTVESKKSAAKFLRTVAALAGADRENLMAAKRTALLVSCRQNLLTRPLEAAPMMIFLAMKKRIGLKRPA